MKRVITGILWICLAGTLTACGSRRVNTAGPSDSSTIVEQAAMQQEESRSASDEDREAAQEESRSASDEDREAVQEETAGAGNVDVDLSEMGSDLVYATVYQMMIDPASYEGKTVRMQGNYYATYYEPTAKYYHYVLIQDALACCAQGMEFVWEDGSHEYPEEYPPDNSLITVTGVFETYTEEGDDYLYCHLRDAQMSIGG